MDPRISTRFSRDFSPATTFTFRFATPKRSAMNATSASFARPSRAGAAMRILRELPWRPATELCLAPGWTWTQSVIAPSGARVNQGDRTAGRASYCGVGLAATRFFGMRPISAQFRVRIASWMMPR